MPPRLPIQTSLPSELLERRTQIRKQIKVGSTGITGDTAKQTGEIITKPIQEFSEDAGKKLVKLNKRM